jgi:site-specific DNA recombinase
VVKARGLEIHVSHYSERPSEKDTGKASDSKACDLAATSIAVPWGPAVFDEVKGIVHSPSPRPSMNLRTREALLGAIAKARVWIDDLVQGRIKSFSEIAMRQSKVERHIRLLAPRAFASPRIISEIADGVAPPHLTVTSLAQRLAYSWNEQGNWERLKHDDSTTS